MQASVASLQLQVHGSQIALADKSRVGPYWASFVSIRGFTPQQASISEVDKFCEPASSNVAARYPICEEALRSDKSMKRAVGEFRSILGLGHRANTDDVFPEQVQYLPVCGSLCKEVGSP